MVIGEDFKKIEFELFGLDLVEPNAIIGNTILLITAIIFAVKISKLDNKSPFFKSWTLFYVVFGISIFVGGLGHTFFYYWGVPGKYLGWLGSILSIYFVEQAMISIYPQKEKINLFRTLSKSKLIIAFLLEIAVFTFAEMDNDPQKGLWVPLVNSAIGFIICLGFLARMYQKAIDNIFYLLWVCLLIMIPAAVIQSMKISIYPWYDRSDMGHTLLLVTLILYWKVIKGFNNRLTHNQHDD